MHLDTLRQASWWTERYLQWCGFWADFLEDVSYVCVWSSLLFGKGHALLSGSVAKLFRVPARARR